jgi:hypothetical protein
MGDDEDHYLMIKANQVIHEPYTIKIYEGKLNRIQKEINKSISVVGDFNLHL